MSRMSVAVTTWLWLPLLALGQTKPFPKPPIIDVHLHAIKLNSYIVSTVTSAGGRET